MNKKKFYIISTCCIIAVLIIFEIVMYFCVGEDVLLEKGTMRVLWMGFPAIIIGLSLVRDYVIKKIYMNDNKKK